MTDMLVKYKHTIICAIILLMLSILGFIMVIARLAIVGFPTYLFLIWNLFLSWIPLGLSMLMSYIFSKNSMKNKHIILIPMGMLWLLFYPNAPYMITDFIHLNNSNSILTWFDLIMFSFFALTSFLIGFVSIYLVSRIVEKKSNRIIGWIFTLLVLFISSYGIFLGRVIRWNSWDLLLRPKELFTSILDNISPQSVLFSLTFGVMLTLIYAFLYGLTYLKLEKAD